ncbi:MAG: hypothetical protein ACI957_005904 [Verrucomicrobiales bacterium]|jgi:hypothetical protein
MHSRIILMALVVTASISNVLAQAPSAPAPPPPTVTIAPTQPVAAPAAGGAQPAAAPAAQPASSSSLFGMELPFMDPGSEVLSWNGKSWNVVNNRMFGARFEKYLSAPAADAAEDKAYRDVLRQILDALSPHQAQKGNLSKAVGLLPIAAAYYHDARLCESLSNTIYGIWLARRNVSALKKANAVLEKQAKLHLWNASVSGDLSEMDKKKEGASPSSSGGNSNFDGSDKVSVIPGESALDNLTQDPEKKAEFAQEKFSSASWTAYYLKKANEVESLAIKNKIGMAASEFQQKLEYQGLIMQYFMQRRFEHVVIATRIYRLLFQDGNARMQLDEDSAVYKSFKLGFGLNPTITTFDALANESIRDVDEGVQSFLHLVEKGELESATKRLSESFAIGEYLPRIRTLPAEKKERVLEFVRHSNQLLSAIDVKNYHLAGELVEKMKLLAKDFDYAKAEGMINATTMTADMLLKKALLAARSGNDEEMQKNLEQAHALYPTNPELKKVTDLILKGSDMESQALSDLDRLMAEGNYRAIQKDQARFAAAVGLSNDPKRLEDLMKVQETLKELEMRMEKSKALVDAGSPEAAWETLHGGAEKFGKDPDYAQLYSKLTVKSANFVHMIEEASRHFENEQFGSSLSWYLKARQAHMKSDLAAQGIEDIVEKLLPASSSNDSDKAESSF